MQDLIIRMKPMTNFLVPQAKLGFKRAQEPTVGGLHGAQFPIKKIVNYRVIQVKCMITNQIISGSKTVRDLYKILAWSVLSADFVLPKSYA